MDTIPVHMRITGLSVTNEDVDSRRAATTELAGAWGKIKDPGQIIAKSAQIAEALGGDGTPPAGLAVEVQGVVQKHASAFLSSERPLEVGICAGMAAVTIIQPEPTTLGWRIADLYANGLWSALSFQPALADEKREKLRLEVLELARAQSLKSAEKARIRETVADPIELTITVSEDQKYATNLKKALSGTIDALRRNAALDREELDFLWWALPARSRVLNRPWTAIAEPVRLVAAGIEGARSLRRLPADVHRDVVLRTLDADPQLSLGDLIAAIGNDRPALAAHFSASQPTAAPAVFPLLNALTTGASTLAGAAEARPASTWGSRALLEAGLAHIIEHGIIQL